MRIVLDTNILISAFIYGGTPQRVLETCIRKNNIQTFHSEIIIRECLRSIQKLHLRHAVKKANITKEDFKKYFHHTSNHIIIQNQHPYPIRDSNDNHILALAEEINANYIITGDKDLLVLEELNNTKILSAKEFLEELN